MEEEKKFYPCEHDYEELEMEIIGPEHCVPIPHIWTPNGSKNIEEYLPWERYPWERHLPWKVTCKERMFLYDPSQLSSCSDEGEEINETD